MKISRHSDDGAMVWLALSGELDMDSADRLEQEVRHVLGSWAPDRLVIDAAGLTFCDSSGIGALMDARAAANQRGVGFQVAGPRGVTRRVMQVTGVFDVLTTGT